MKVQLIVVRGKPEGKVIPLAGPKFKIGRGETCHLRPNSEQVSREHAEFEISSTAVQVRDLGSRNGTLVNGKALTTEAYKLKDRDLVQVGPLTFAVSITDAPPPAQAAPRPAATSVQAAPPVQAKPKASPDDVSTDDIDSWLLGESTTLSPDQPAAVYGGDTITITAFKDAQAPSPPPNKPPSVADDSEYERQSAEEEEAKEESPAEEYEEPEENEEDQEEEDENEKSLEDEFMDPSNPFYVAKKSQKGQAKTGPGTPAANQTFKDSSDAANEILRKLMERRRASKS
ncbi:MAG: FHA domain-containing protein [Isosphaeraceae bacterium]